MSEPGSLTTRCAEEVRALMARRRLSQHAVADMIGVSQSYLSRRLVGDQPFTLDDVEALAAALGVDPLFLLTGPAPG